MLTSVKQKNSHFSTLKMLNKTGCIIWLVPSEEWKSICMGWLMLGLDCYLGLGQEFMGLMKSWVGIGVGKVIKNVSWVITSVKVLWECPTYSSSRADLLLELQEKLGNGFECFNSLGKSSFIVGSELWENHFDSLLALVKNYIVNIWETRQVKLYGDDSSQSLSSTEDLGDITGCVREMSLTLSILLYVSHKFVVQ